MDAIIEFILSIPVLAYATIAILVVFLVILVVLVVIAFRQDRPVELWKLKIGTRPRRDIDQPSTNTTTMVVGPSIETDPDERLYVRLSERYGLGYESMRLVYQIDADGSAKLTRVVEVVAKSQLQMLDTFVNVRKEHGKSSSEGEHFTTGPEVEVASRTIGIAFEIRRNPPSTSVTILSSTSSLEIAPSLKPEQRATYELIQRLSSTPEDRLHNAFATRKMMEQHGSKDDVFGYDEFFAWHINRPTRNLQMKVVFPEGWNFRFHDSDVLYAAVDPFPTTIRQQEEGKRLKIKSDQDDYHRSILHLNVDYPMLGLVYVIKWRPVLG